MPRLYPLLSGVKVNEIFFCKMDHSTLTANVQRPGYSSSWSKISNNSLAWAWVEKGWWLYSHRYNIKKITLVVKEVQRLFSDWLTPIPRWFHGREISWIFTTAVNHSAGRTTQNKRCASSTTFIISLMSNGNEDTNLYRYLRVKKLFDISLS